MLLSKPLLLKGSYQASAHTEPWLSSPFLPLACQPTYRPPFPQYAVCTMISLLQVSPPLALAEHQVRGPLEVGGELTGRPHHMGTPQA